MTRKAPQTYYLFLLFRVLATKNSFSTLHKFKKSLILLHLGITQLYIPAGIFEPESNATTLHTWIRYPEDQLSSVPIVIEL